MKPFEVKRALFVSCPAPRLMPVAYVDDFQGFLAELEFSCPSLLIINVHAGIEPRRKLLYWRKSYISISPAVQLKSCALGL